MGEAYNLVRSDRHWNERIDRIRWVLGEPIRENVKIRNIAKNFLFLTIGLAVGLLIGFSLFF